MKIVKSRSKPSCRQISGLNSEEKKERRRQEMVEYRKVSPPPTSVDDCLGLPVTALTWFLYCALDMGPAEVTGDEGEGPTSDGGVPEG